MQAVFQVAPRQPQTYRAGIYAYCDYTVPPDIDATIAVAGSDQFNSARGTVPSATDVGGLGDGAFYGDSGVDLTLYTHAHGTFFTVTVHGPAKDRIRANELQLAQRVVSRLNGV